MFQMIHSESRFQDQISQIGVLEVMLSFQRLEVFIGSPKVSLDYDGSFLKDVGAKMASGLCSGVLSLLTLHL